MNVFLGVNLRFGFSVADVVLLGVWLCCSVGEGEDVAKLKSVYDDKNLIS